MTIWLLAVLLLAILGLAGHHLGAIRASITFLGILFSALLAGLVGKLLKPILSAVGVTNPVMQWVLPPLIGFIVLSVVFQIIAHIVHQKVDVYYKYKAGDLRLSLWERLNARLGACVGILNGVTYLILISFVIHAFSYWTVQMASSEGDTKTLRLLNQLGRDLQKTGMARVAKAVDPMKNSFYDTADLTGLLYQNPLLEARLLRYPGFLSLGERQEFQTLGQDTTFAELRAKRTPVSEVLNHPAAKGVFQSPEVLRQLWDTVQPDLADLQEFLKTGKSAKYDGEPLLGRWQFDANSSLLAYRRTKPNITGSEAAKLRSWMNEKFAKSMIVAGPDKMVVLKNFPQLKLQPGQPPNAELKNLKGTWESDGSDYKFDLEGGTDKRTAKFEGSRLMVSGDGMAIALVKED